MRLYDLADQVDRLAQTVAAIALVNHQDPIADLAKDVSLKIRALKSDLEVDVEGSPV